MCESVGNADDVTMGAIMTEYLNVPFVESFLFHTPHDRFTREQLNVTDLKDQVCHCFVAGLFSCMLIFLSRESDQSAITSSLRSCQPVVYLFSGGRIRYVPFPTAQQANVTSCSSRYHFHAKRQAGKL